MSIAIQHLGGWRFAVKCRDHQIISDQPREEDGEDTGMTPVELFTSSLGCCIGVYAKIFCDRHNINSEGMELNLEFQKAESPPRVSKIIVTIHFKEGIDADLAQGIIRMAKQCTVHNTLQNPPKIEVSLSSP